MASFVHDVGLGAAAVEGSRTVVAAEGLLLEACGQRHDLLGQVLCEISEVAHGRGLVATLHVGDPGLVVLDHLVPINDTKFIEPAAVHRELQVLLRAKLELLTIERAGPLKVLGMSI